MSTIKNLVRIGDSLQRRTLGRIEPQKSYMFEVQFFDQNSLVPSFGEIKYNVKSVNVPSFSKEVIVRPFMNTKINYAGKVADEKQITIVFWDDEGMSVLDYIHKWYALSGDLEFNDGLDKESYIKTIRVSLKDTTDSLITGNFTFKNAHPINISELNLTYDDSAAIEVSVTFAYDFVGFGDGLSANLEKIDGIATIFGYGGSVTSDVKDFGTGFFNGN